MSWHLATKDEINPGSLRSHRGGRIPWTGWPQWHGLAGRISWNAHTNIETRRPVYLHCWGGRGRTGTVVGCYLVRHGLCASHEAVNEIRDLRKYTEDLDEPSPESRRQFEMVLSWVEGD